MGSENLKKSPGLIISNTESIRSFLLSASKDHKLSEELQKQALNLSSLNNVPYKSVRELWLESQHSTRPDLIHLFTRTEFVFTSPKPREKVNSYSIRSVWLMRKMRNGRKCSQWI